jgi:hypothetical protein
MAQRKGRIQENTYTHTHTHTHTNTHTPPFTVLFVNRGIILAKEKWRKNWAEGALRAQ